MTAIPPSRQNPSFPEIPAKNVENSPVSQESSVSQDNPVAKKGKEKLINQPVVSTKDLQESKIDQLTKRESLQDASLNFEKELAEIATSLGLGNTVETRDVNKIIGALIGLYQTGGAINSVSAGLLPNLNLIQSYIHLTEKASEQIAEHGQVSSLLSQASKLLSMINHLSLTIQNKQFLEEKLEALSNKKEQLVDLKKRDKDDVSIEKKALLEGIKDLERYIKKSNFEIEDNTEDFEASPLLPYLEALNEQKEQFAYIDEETILKQINVLERNIQASKFEINDSIKEFGVRAVLFLPEAADKVYSSVKFFGNIANSVPIASSLGIAGSVGSVIDAGYQWYKADVAMHSHKRHISDLGSMKLAENVNPVEGSISLKDQNELKLKQKEEATKWLDDLLDEHKDDFTGFKQEVEKVGFILDPSIVSFNEVTSEVKDALILARTNQKITEKLVAKRNEELSAKLENNKKWLDDLLDKHKDDFTSFKQEVEKTGFILDPSIVSFNEVNDYVKDILIKNYGITPNQRIIQNLIYKRQNEFNTRLVLETQWFDELASQYKDDFDSFKLELERSGLKLDESIKSFQGITEEIKNTLLKNHVELGVTLLANAKNQLKARLEKNEELNQEFFTFKSLKARIMYGVTSASAIVTISLLAGMIAGGVFPPALLIIPGVLTIVATVGLMALGMHHLYKHKPNLFNAYLNFVPVKLAINNILLAVSEICLKFVDWKEERDKKALLLEKIDEITSEYFKVLNAKQKDLSKPIEEQEMKDITAIDLRLAKEGLIKQTEENFETLYKDELEILHQESSSDYWKNLVNEYQKNVDDLEATVLQARKDDFTEYSGFESIKKFKEELEYTIALEIELKAEAPDKLSVDEKEALKYLPKRIVNLENKIASLQGKTLDEFDIIAESLIKGEFWKDPESRAFIEKYAGVEFGEDVQLDRSNLKENTKFLSSKLKHIILKDSKELLRWVEKQNINEVEI